MRSVLLAVQYASIIGLFIESWIIFRRLNNSLLAYLFLSCLAILINNLGYLFQLLSTTQESYITALKFSYAGRTWVTFFLFLFTIDFCKIKLSATVKSLLVFAHIGIYFAILTVTKNNLYYTWTAFDASGIFPILRHGNGVIHHLYMALQSLYIVVGFFWLFSSLLKEKSLAAKKRLMAVIMAFLIECIFFVIKMLKLIPLVSFYDVTIFGYVAGIVFMFIAFFRYDLLGAKEIAREFMIDRLSEGIIAVDTSGNIQYCNKPAREMFPDMAIESEKTLLAIQGAVANGSSLTVRDRIYTAEENDLIHGDKVFGKLYVLIDATEHYERFKKEKRILQRELRIDPMTGLYNRTGMEHFSKKLYDEALEGGKALFICVCDMNGLKYINDNFGHEEGDRAIRTLSQILKNSADKNDMAFRIGGDEFLLLGLRDAENLSTESFRERVEEVTRLSNQSLNLPYKIDMSYGPLTKKIEGKSNEMSDLMRQSDNMMYEMKKNRDAHIR